MQAGDQLARAAHHRRDEHVDVTVVGVAAAQQVGRGVADRGLVTQVEAHQAASVLWAMASPQSFATTGIPESSAAATASSGSGTLRSGSTGTPYWASRRFERASERVVEVIGVKPDHTAWVRSFQYSSRRTRLSSLPASVRGSSSRSS